MNIAAIAANPVARGPVQTEFIKDILAVGKALASDDLEAAQDKFKEFRQEVLRLHPGGIEQTKLSREIKDDLWGCCRRSRRTTSRQRSTCMTRWRGMCVRARRRSRLHNPRLSVD